MVYSILVSQKGWCSRNLYCFFRTLVLLVLALPAFKTLDNFNFNYLLPAVIIFLVRFVIKEYHIASYYLKTNNSSIFSGGGELRHWFWIKSNYPQLAQDTIGYLFSVLTIIFISPFLEELVFRGSLWNFLLPNVGLISTWVITTLCFGTWHFIWDFTKLRNVSEATLAGLIYGTPLLAFTSLWPSILGHSLFNFLFNILTQEDHEKLIRLFVGRKNNSGNNNQPGNQGKEPLSTYRKHIHWMAEALVTCPTEALKNELLEHWVYAGNDPFNPEDTFESRGEGRDDILDDILRERKNVLREKLEDHYLQMQQEG